jgi:hypothetical protein
VCGLSLSRILDFFGPLQDGLHNFANVFTFAFRRTWTQIIFVKTISLALFRAVQPFGKYRAAVKIPKFSRLNGKSGPAGMGEQKKPRHKLIEVSLIADHAKPWVTEKRRSLGPYKPALGAFFE